MRVRITHIIRGGSGEGEYVYHPGQIIANHPDAARWIGEGKAAPLEEKAIAPSAEASRPMQSQVTARPPVINRAQRRPN